MRPISSRHAVAFILSLVLAVGIAGGALAADPTFARLETDEGNILVVFYPELAPHHVGNFVHLSRTGFYDGTKFHRIMPGFIIQGGDPNSKDMDPRNDGLGGPTLADILTEEDAQVVSQVNELLESKGYTPITGDALLKAEFSKTAHHLRGTFSMARSPRGIDTAGSQFFICVDKTAQLDGQYSIFGHVVSGMEVADIIVNAEKNPAAGRDYPAVPVALNKSVIIEGTGGLTPEEKAAWDAMPAGLKNVK